MTQAKSAPGRKEMGRGRSPEPLDFFIWTVEDVGLWLEEINLGGYRQVFEENGVNGEYLESLSMFTTEQILRFIRRCHMKWGDFITLCKELRRIKVPLPRYRSSLKLELIMTPLPNSPASKGSKKSAGHGGRRHASP
uniref:SAM domain-containing protein n=2 Tax=Zea mays TaxID=4577 RepID=A0A804N628_MAIZE